MTEVAASPQSYGHYDVESVLGRGAMGMVYLARDRRIGRKVALKTVHLNERFDDEDEANEFYKRLQREAELCGALQHPNIVTLYEPGYGENNVIAWLATEYIDGENLRDRMRKRKPLPMDETLRILEGILRGLAYAHAKGIVHRDIKPANILLTASGEAKIADFGIARPLDSNLTAVGEMLGTPSYMSPEQVRCQPVTVRSDLFSVGAVLYEMATGVKAFGASDVTGILRNVVEMNPRPMHEVSSDIPAPLSRFVERLFAKKPEERFSSAVEALDELHRIRQDFAPGDEPEMLQPLELGHSTLAAPVSKLSDTGTIPPSATQPDIGDATPAVGTRRTLLTRTIPPAFFWLITAIALALPAALIIAIRADTNPSPTFSFTNAQLRSFQAKKTELRAARGLILAGKFEEGIAAYDAYLQKYPNSPAARAEIAEARAALEKANAERSHVTVTETRPVVATPEKPKETPKKPSFFQRIFRRGNTTPQQAPPKKKP
jgi:serine/threonine protein kinase